MSVVTGESLFVFEVERWYRSHQRPLPWRINPTPYSIWLAEIIFQQTRIEQGMKYYLNFIKKYPHIQNLAEADEDEVLQMWQGLGYYSRAINLHKTAKIVASRGGIFPSDPRELRRLPGIGPYTAGAISSIAFGQRSALVDGNVTRLIARYFGIHSEAGHSDTIRLINRKAEYMVSLCTNPSEYNQGLMDIGSMICKPSKPRCNQCPLTKNCFAFRNNLTDELPAKKVRPNKSVRYLLHVFLKADGKIAVQKRDSKEIWKNLYQLPILLDTRSTEEKTAFENSCPLKILDTCKHILSHQILFITIYKADHPEDLVGTENILFVEPFQISQMGFPVPFRKFFLKNLQ